MIQITAMVLLLGTPGFPAGIDAELSLQYFPPCTICHQDDLGGAGTVVKPFGNAMIARGLEPDDNQSLIDALAAMESDAVDSDSDGVGDVQELRNKTDPNGSGAFDGPSPIYGCGGGHLTGYRPEPSYALMAGLGLAALGIGWRRRRRVV